VSPETTLTLDAIWRRVVSRSPRSRSSIHGITHWVRVERNGLYIAERTGADPTVISLFALFHDCRRENDGWDPGHGRRGAEYAESVRGELSILPDEDFGKLRHACVHHTDRTRHDDPTVAACWDADRLELGRVGIEPREKYFNTAPAREIVRDGGFEVLEKCGLRQIPRSARGDKTQGPG
jgi:uncharacterized protein